MSVAQPRIIIRTTHADIRWCIYRYPTPPPTLLPQTPQQSIMHALFFFAFAQSVGTPQQLQALARDVAIRDARRQSDRRLPQVLDVEKALFVPGDGNEPQEWWTAFENGYM